MYCRAEGLDIEHTSTATNIIYCCMLQSILWWLMGENSTVV